jgi:hypothetical protein
MNHSTRETTTIVLTGTGVGAEPDISPENSKYPLFITPLASWSTY